MNRFYAGMETNASQQFAQLESHAHDDGSAREHMEICSSASIPSLYKLLEVC